MTDLPPPSGPPPGWYPDPATGQGFRWWDGSAWTAQTIADLEQSNRMAPAGQWLREAMRLAISRAGHLFPLIVVLNVPVNLLFAVAFWYALHGAVFSTEPGTRTLTNPDGSVVRYGLLVAAMVLSFLTSVVLSSAAVHQARAALHEEPVPWSDSLLATLRRLPAVLLAGAASAVVIAGLYLAFFASVALAPVLVLATFPLWLVGSALAAVRFSLAVPAATVGPSPGRALATSWSLTRTRFWALFGRLVLLLLLGLSVLFLAQVVASPIVALAGGGAKETITPGATRIPVADVVGDNPAAFAIGQLFSALGGGAATILVGVATFLLYRELGGAGAEPAAEPVAANDGPA